MSLKYRKFAKQNLYIMNLKHILHLPIELIMSIKHPFARFLVVGVINTIVGYTLFVLCRWVGMNTEVAVLVSTVLAVTFNYHSTGKLVFHNKGYKVIIQFFVVYGIMYFINVWELKYFLPKTGIYDVLISIDKEHLDIVSKYSLEYAKVCDAMGQLIVVLPNAMLTYFLNKTLVFSQNKTK